MNQVTVNGRTYNLPSGSSVSVINNDVYVDGKQITQQLVPPEVRVKIEWTGPLANLTVRNGSVECGAVGGSVDSQGSVQCKDVKGDVTADGSVTCGAVSGNVKADGSVVCHSVGGNVKAGGSVVHR